jgi:hypothetical protein
MFAATNIFKATAFSCATELFETAISATQNFYVLSSSIFVENKAPISPRGLCVISDREWFVIGIPRVIGIFPWEKLFHVVLTQGIGESLDEFF